MKSGVPIQFLRLSVLCSEAVVEQSLQKRSIAGSIPALPLDVTFVVQRSLRKGPGYTLLEAGAGESKRSRFLSILHKAGHDTGKRIDPPNG